MLQPGYVQNYGASEGQGEGGRIAAWKQLRGMTVNPGILEIDWVSIHFLGLLGRYAVANRPSQKL